MSRGVSAVLLTVVILALLAWAVGSGGGRTLAATSTRACPPGTYLALDGFCTHVYVSPTPTSVAR